MKRDWLGNMWAVAPVSKAEGWLLLWDEGESRATIQRSVGVGDGNCGRTDATKVLSLSMSTLAMTGAMKVTSGGGQWSPKASGAVSGGESGAGGCWWEGCTMACLAWAVLG